MIGEIHLSHRKLVLMGTIRDVPEATIRTTWQAFRDTDGWTGFYGVDVPERSDFDAVGAALEADETVAEAHRVAARGRQRIYRVELTPDVRLITPELIERGGGLIEARSDDDGWLARVHLPDSRTLAALRRFCRDREIRFRTERLYNADDLATAISGLTDPQRQLLLAAYEAGYFEEPRAITLEGLADRLDISPTAAGGRLRRAMARLVEAQLPVGNVRSEL